MMMKRCQSFRISTAICLIAILFLNLGVLSASGQENEILTIVSKISSDENYSKKLGIREPGLLKKIYESNNYLNLWIGGTESFLNDFLKTVAQAERYGLVKEKYTVRLSSNSLENEIMLTDAILSFFNDMALGNIPVDFVYNGLGYTKDNCLTIDWILLNSIKKNDFKNTINTIQPSSIFYQELVKMLQKIMTIHQSNSWDEELIKNTASLTENRPLFNKLYYLGIIPSLQDTLSIDEANITEALMRFQRMFNLEEDGKLDRIVLQKLNIPMTSIQEILAENINKCRWLTCIEHEKFIRINIPSANLKLYAYDSLLLSMKVIVGKPSTSTPVFCAKLNQITFFPYWNVPRSIAIKEFLPILKRNINFLENNGIQVLNTGGHVIDEKQLDWSKYNSKNFPYRFRQVTGCDNSLGIVKFDIEDPFSIYMHDTNHKELFGRDKRFLSHGCIRLEKPYDLAAILLENQQQVDAFFKQRFNKNLKPITLKLKETIPVFISYFTVDINENNEIVFYDNIYHK